MSGRKALVSALVCVASLAFVGSALALDIADASPPSGTTGVPYSYTFRLSEGSGSSGSGWSISSGQLPPGLALSSNDRTATVYGTPTRAGEFRFYLQVRDAPGPWHCCTEEEFTIAIRDGLGISTPELPVGNVGSSYGYQLATSGGAATAWTVAAGTLPPGVALTPDGAITGTPTQAAVTQFTVRVVSGDRTASKQFTLKVTEPLLATAPGATAIKLGRQFLLPFAVKGGLGPYTWSGIDLPAGIGVNPKTGQVGGRPNAAGELIHHGEGDRLARREHDREERRSGRRRPVASDHHSCRSPATGGASRRLSWRAEARRRSSCGWRATSLAGSASTARPERSREAEARRAQAARLGQADEEGRQADRETEAADSGRLQPLRHRDGRARPAEYEAPDTHREAVS